MSEEIIKTPKSTEIDSCTPVEMSDVASIDAPEGETAPSANAVGDEAIALSADKNKSSDVALTPTEPDGIGGESVHAECDDLKVEEPQVPCDSASGGDDSQINGAEQQDPVTSQNDESEDYTDGNVIATETTVAYDSFSSAQGELERLTEAFPMLWQTERLEDIPEYERYVALRAMGLDEVEAFGAAAARRLSEAEKRRRLAAGKAHLRPIVSSSSHTQSMLSEEQKRFARATLGKNLSDAELERLWSRAMPTSSQHGNY